MNAHATVKAAPRVLRPEGMAEGRGFVATVGMIDGWVNAARPGDRCVYARLPVLPSGCAGGMRAHGLYGLGLVTLERQRWPENPAMFEYRMRRREPARRPAASPAPALCPDEAALLAYIEARAEAGDEMEMNPDIARRLEMRDGARVGKCLNVLIDKGLVRRQPMQRRPFRVITVVASGLRTAGNPE